ncbi:hypothetical protein Tel_14665 [Candidatus Tenderia electrophaga]|uniref:histidine kinase n=1 Tax=Candidatus Tenderia electrophaga TaxID=1748243 RepID=A0A0S2TGL4_9GAMM|nr:hypothetical protein Tel_14665 [Candidatus Tenderia electrophaga]
MKHSDYPAGKLRPLVSSSAVETIADQQYFQRIVRIAAQHFDVPFAWIGLLDTDGFSLAAAQGVALRRVDTDQSLCRRIIESSEDIDIADTHKDPRWAQHPMVIGAPYVRSFAAARLRSPEGIVIGALIVADKRPHGFSPRRLDMLRDLADCVEPQFVNLGRARMTPAIDEATQAELRKLALVASRTEDAVIITDADGVIEWVNKGFTRISGFQLGEVVGKKPGEILQGPETDPATVQFMRERLRAGEGFRTEIINYGKQGEKYWLALEVQPVRDNSGRIINFIAIERDITQRKRATEELRRVNYTLDNTHDMIFMFEAESLRFVYLNKGAVASMGYSREELLQMTPYQIKPHIPESRFREMIEPLLNGEKDALHFETVHRHKNGHDFAVEVFLQLVRDEESGEARFVAIVRNISERKRAEQEMRQYTASLEKLHAITTDPKLDLDGKIQALLALGREVFGLPLAIVSHIVEDRYCVEYSAGPPQAPPPGAQFPLDETYCSHTLHANHPIGFHHVGNSKIRNHPCYRQFGLESYIGTPLLVGHERYGTLNFSGPERRPTPFSHFHYSLIRLFAQWVGSQLEQHITTQALYRETALRQAILDSANLSIISTEVDGTITSFNKGAERLLGYAADEVIGKMTPGVIHDKDEISRRADVLTHELGRSVAPGFEVFVAKAKQGQIDEREWTYIRKDGSRFPVLLSITAVYDSDGKVNGFLGIASDITERKKIEQMKREFVSTVSHELRTPLTSIRGALGLLLGGAAGPMRDEGRAMLDVAQRNSKRLTLLINDLLDLEKIESGRLEFNVKPLDLVALAHSALEANEAYARQHNVSLRLTCAPEQAMVQGDENRLLQVFANLISNAVKYSPERETVRLTIERKAEFYRVAVIDQGPGIPEEFRARIFERFAQADSSDTREKGGTGLGLSISKVIVERHGGRIGFDSEVGKGACFYFDLPPYQHFGS